MLRCWRAEPGDASPTSTAQKRPGVDGSCDLVVLATDFFDADRRGAGTSTGASASTVGDGSYYAEEGRHDPHGTAAGRRTTVKGPWL